MRLTFSTDDGDVFSIDVEPSTDWSTVAALVEANCGVPVTAQEYAYNGQHVTPPAGQTIAGLGLKDDDMIYVRRRVAAAGSASASARPTAGKGGKRKLLSLPTAAPKIDPAVYASLTWDTLPSHATPKEMYDILQVNTGMMAQIKKSDPELYTAAVVKDGGQAFSTEILKRNLQRALPEAERRTKLAQLEHRLATNPYDVEAQKLLEEEIERQNIANNMELALEHMPEAFGSVHMLYVNAMVNNVPIRAFVDSGAQSTIMSVRAAERCGIMRLVDRKFAGTAVGVGKAKIVGRVHMAGLTLLEPPPHGAPEGTQPKHHHFPCTFTVLDQNDMDFLLGLDMLKRYSACIDLRSYRLVLHMGGGDEAGGVTVAVPFLGEKESKSLYADASMEEASSTGGGAGGAHSSGTASSSSGTAGGGLGGGAAPSPAPPNSAAGGSGGASSGAGAAATAHAGRAGGAPPAAATPAGGLRFDFSGIAAGSPSSASSAGGSSGTGTGTGGQAQAGAAAQSFDPTTVALLESMGFPRAKVLQALTLTGGNAELAAAMLPDL